MKLKNQNIVIIKCLVVILVAVLAEIFVFNYQHFLTNGNNYRAIGFDQMEMLVGNGYATTYQDGTETINVLYLDELDNDSAGVTFSTDVDIENIAINARGIGDTFTYNDYSDKLTSVVDAASLYLTIYFIDNRTMALEEVYSGVFSLKDGEADTFNVPNRDTSLGSYCIVFKTSVEQGIIVKSIEVNVVPKLYFNVIRCLAFMLILLACAFFNGIRKALSSEVSIKYVLAMAVVFSAISLFMIFSNKMTGSANVIIDAYNELANSLLQGKTTVLDEYADALSGFENVYDFNARQESGIKYMFDYAYYKGHYYVYFGIVPCVLFYLPWRIITGTNILNSVVLAIVMTLLIFSIAMFIYEFQKRYEYKLSKLRYTFMYMLVMSAAMVPFLSRLALVYQIVQISAIMFVLWGLMFYIKAGDMQRTKHVEAFIAVGSFLMALSAGCRPQTTLLAVLAAVFLWERMVKKNKLVIRYWCAFLIPYIIVAIPLMYYNYIRFGSAFDFGVNYNLTSDNILEFSINFEKVLAGFKYMFWDTPELTKIFPFFKYMQPEYNIDRQIGATIGGYFTTNIIIVLGLIPVIRSNSTKANKIQTTIVQYCFVAFSLFIAIFDVVFCGCIERYKVDFGIWLGLATAIVCCNMLSNGIKNYMKVILCVGLLMVVVTSYLISFFSSPAIVSYYDKELIYQITRTIQFWI